jgi:hypothetical protein
MNVADLQSRLNAITDETVVAAKALDWINDAQNDVASRYNWSWLQESNSFLTVDGTPNYSLESDLDRILTVKVGDRELQPKSIQWLNENDPGYSEDGDTGEPTHYTLFKGQIYLYPTPEDVETVYYKYKKTVDVLDDSTDISEVPAKYHEVLVYGAYLRWLLADEADQNMIENGKREYESMIQRMQSDEEQTKQANQPIPWERREIR